MEEHTCNPKGSCTILQQKLLESTSKEKVNLMSQLGETGCSHAYSFLKSYVHTEFRKPALVAMAKINYTATIDIIVGLLKKDNEEKETIETLSVIFDDRAQKQNWDYVLDEFKNTFPPPDNRLKNILLCSFSNAIRFSNNIPNTEVPKYLTKINEMF